MELHRILLSGCADALRDAFFYSTSASEGSPKSITPLDGSEQRRTAQNQAEKQRRNILKSGFEELKVYARDGVLELFVLVGKGCWMGLVAPMDACGRVPLWRQWLYLSRAWLFSPAILCLNATRHGNSLMVADVVQVMVPECGNGQSKAKILHKAVDYVHELVREKASLFREVDKLRQEVQQLRGVLNQYEAMQGQEGEALPRPLPEAFRRERRDPADLMDVKFYVVCVGCLAFLSPIACAQSRSIPYGRLLTPDFARFPRQFCVVIDRLYESFCATVSMDNTSAFTTSLMKWFEVHCNAETFFKPLHSLGSRFITEVWQNRAGMKGGLY